MATYRATTISGKDIRGATWKADAVGPVAIGHVINLNVATRDEKLLKKIGRNSLGISVDPEEDGYSVTLGFVVERFTHMLETSGGKAKLDTMVWMKPMNRSVEAVAVYLLDPDSVDPKFAKLVMEA